MIFCMVLRISVAPQDKFDDLFSSPTLIVGWPVPVDNPKLTESNLFSSPTLIFGCPVPVDYPKLTESMFYSKTCN
jgi:hypothetical protein